VPSEAREEYPARLADLAAEERQRRADFQARLDELRGLVIALAERLAASARTGPGR
jgi:hypothetical protein